METPAPEGADVRVETLADLVVTEPERFSCFGADEAGQFGHPQPIFDRLRRFADDLGKQCQVERVTDERRDAQHVDNLRWQTAEPLAHRANDARRSGSLGRPLPDVAAASASSTAGDQAARLEPVAQNLLGKERITFALPEKVLGSHRI